MPLKAVGSNVPSRRSGLDFRLRCSLADFGNGNCTVSVSIAEKDPIIAQVVSDNVLVMPVAAIFDVAAFFVVDGL